MRLWHSSHNDNGDETSCEDQEQSNVLQIRNEAIAKDVDTAAKPNHAQKSNVGVPCLNDQVRMEHSVHLHQNIGRDICNRSKVEDPAEKVQPAAEEPKTPAPSRTRSDGRPVIDASSSGNS